MRTGANVLGWILAASAAAAIVGAAALFGVGRGVFSAGHEDEVARILLADHAVQRSIAAAAVDEVLEQVPALEVARPQLDEAAVRITKTDRYAEVFGAAVDLAYERARAPGGPHGPVVLSLNDLVGLLGSDALPVLGAVDLGSFGDEGIVLVEARDLGHLRQAREAAERWSWPLLGLGVVLAIAALVLPGGRAVRTIGLGLMISAFAALAFLTTDQAGSRLAAEVTQPGAGVIEALWVSAAPSVRAWLGGAFMAGLLVVVAGFLLNAEHD